MAMNQLIYISQATRKLTGEELSEIHQTASKNNQKIDVTGSLFYNGGWFLQVLEGPISTLNTLY
jgi:hypothetical protein